MKKNLLILTFLLGILSLGFSAAPGVEEISGLTSTSVQISLYPNPTNGVVFLNIDAAFDKVYQVKIVNLIGQTLHTENITTNQRKQIDLQSFPPGVYFVQVEDGDSKIMKRLVIQ